jgi:hypothetical protein
MIVTPRSTRNPSGRPSRSQARFAFIILFAINMLNYADRYVLPAILPKARQVLGLTTIEEGLLGSSFLLVYGLATLPPGVWADRGIRKNIIRSRLRPLRCLFVASPVLSASRRVCAVLLVNRLFLVLPSSYLNILYLLPPRSVKMGNSLPAGSSSSQLFSTISMRPASFSPHACGLCGKAEIAFTSWKPTSRHLPRRRALPSGNISDLMAFQRRFYSKRVYAVGAIPGSSSCELRRFSAPISPHWARACSERGVFFLLVGCAQRCAYSAA